MNPLTDLGHVNLNIEGPTWTTETLQRDFTVLGFLAPFVVVVRKVDGVKGSLLFQHRPRVYFGWTEDRDAAR